MKFKQNEYFKHCNKRHTVYFDFKLNSNKYYFDIENTRTLAFGNEKFTKWIEEKVRQKFADLMVKYENQRIDYNTFKEEFFTWFIDFINSNSGLNPNDLIWYVLESFFWLVIQYLHLSKAIKLSMNKKIEVFVNPFTTKKGKDPIINEIIDLIDRLFKEGSKNYDLL